MPKSEMSVFIQIFCC